jgi:hypothetical protein
MDISQINLANIDIYDPFKNTTKKINTKTKKQTFEYADDIKKSLIKSTINELCLLLSEESDKLINYKNIKILQNIIILHEKELTNMNIFTPLLINNIQNMKLGYAEFHILKILQNIKQRKYVDNLSFGYINNSNLSNKPPISEKKRLYIEKKLPSIKPTRYFKKKNNSFKVNQIVGAKDKENKWWLSRVLHIHDTPEACWYYIKFEGWDDIHNEWINANTYRVRWFNPRKHFLKK